MHPTTRTIHTTAAPTALTLAVAREIRQHWERGDLGAVSDAAIAAVCSHLRRVPDERLDPRLNDAIESFLAFEYREGDHDALREAAPEDVPGQLVIDFDGDGDDQVIAGPGFTGDVRDAVEEIEADQTCTWDVHTKADGSVEFKNVRPLHRLSLVPKAVQP